MMSRWFRARTMRERWLVVFFLWSAVLLWGLLGSARLGSGWHDWRTARSSASLLAELEQRRVSARARVQAATAQSSASSDPAADLASAAGTLRVTAEPAAAPGLARWTLDGQDLLAADMVEVYRRVRALGGNVQVVEATVTAAATEGRVDCRLTVRAWTP